MNEIIRVPVASDNTFFSPVLISGNTYTIGEKGEEEHIHDYMEALEMLSQMIKARWRRPNRNNNRGIVAAVQWVEVIKEVLLNAKSINLSDLMEANEVFLKNQNERK